MELLEAKEKKQLTSSLSLNIIKQNYSEEIGDPPQKSETLFTKILLYQRIKLFEKLQRN